MADDILSFDPERVSQLLQDEANGKLPAPWLPVLDKLRTKGALPPPLVGGANRTLGQYPSLPKPPVPAMTTLQSAEAAVPGALKSMKAAGKATLETVADPEAAAAVGGGLVGTALGGPAGGVIGAGAAPALVAAGREGYQSLKTGKKPEFKAPMLSAATSGVAGELGARLLPHGVGAEMTPIGRETSQLLGEKAMVPDLVASPGWDFARNVAREGFLGRRKMLGREQENAASMLGKVTDEAVKELPQPPAQALIRTDKSAAGRGAQDQLRAQFTQATSEGKALYGDFMKEFGDLPMGKPVKDVMTGVESKPPSLKAIHAQRSDALEAARKAAASNDYKGQMEAMKQVHRLSDKINTFAPEDVSKAYNQLSSEYGKIMEQYDNPVVRHLREDVPAEKLVDVMLNPSQLNTFAPFRAMSTVPGRSMPAHQSVSQEDAVHLVRMAVGEDTFKQLRSDAIMALGQESKAVEHGATEQLVGKDLMAKLDKMPPNVQEALFGPDAARNIDQIARVTAHTQRTRSGTGALWIVMRQPSAALGLGASMWEAGRLTGHSEAGRDAGVGTAGAIILTPLILSSILRSPRTAQLFTRALAAEPTMRTQLMQRLLTQIPSEAAREAF